MKGKRLTQIKAYLLNSETFKENLINLATQTAIIIHDKI
jgi:hypothetical protein